MSHKKYRRNPNISFRQEKDEVVVLSPKDGDLFVLNETAAFIWQKLEQPQTVAWLVDALLVEYDVILDIALSDVQDCLEIMRKNRWILSEAVTP